jgi:hypothetical protein
MPRKRVAHPQRPAIAGEDGMIEVKVWGEGESWTAAVTKPSRGPEATARRADLAVLRAITAHKHATDGAWMECHRCGNRWRPRVGKKTRPPKVCPNCKQPWKYRDLVEIGLHEPPRSRRDDEA